MPHFITILIAVLILMVLPAISIILWLSALSHILKSKFKDSKIKTKWIIIVIILPIVGALLYFSFGKKQVITKNISNGS